MINGNTDLPVEEAPIACLLTPEELRQRGDQVVRPLFAAHLEARQLADGYALRFPGDGAFASKLLAFITEERACCPFFTFELHFEHRQGPIWLHLRGPEGTREMVAGMLAQVTEQ